MSCACQTGNRQLAIIVDFENNAFDEFIDYAQLAGWESRPEHQVVVVPVGPSHSLGTRCEVEKLLCGVLGAGVARQLRYVPLQPNKALEDQLERLKDAQPLVFDDGSASPPVLEMLEQRRIETWIQPVLNARNFEVWGFECLMRSRDAEGNLISPAEIITSARQENLLFMLDRVCRETHLANATRLVEDRDLRILINFLPTAIYQPQFCLRSTFAQARKSGLDPQKVIFEVVETEAIEDHEHLKNILEEYRRSGFGIALDDVGMGFSGLQILADLQPDLIKIDRKMATEAVKSPWYETVCRMLVQAGHDQGKLVLAEGIETEEQEAAMLNMGIDLLQGFRYAKPAPTSSLTTAEDALCEAFRPAQHATAPTSN